MIMLSSSPTTLGKSVWRLSALKYNVPSRAKERAERSSCRNMRMQMDVFADCQNRMSVDGQLTSAVLEHPRPDSHEYKFG